MARARAHLGGGAPVNDKDPAAYDLLTYAWVFLLSLMGGVVAFLQKLRDGSARVFNLIEFIGELCTSAFTGVVTFYLCESAQFPPVLTAALVGIAGHMGNRGLFLIEKFLSNKLK
jgi:hypothetical protein